MYSWSTWNASWAWSLALVALTIAIHVIGVVLIAKALEKLRPKFLQRGLAYIQGTSVTIVVIIGVALSLAVLHAVESMVWAIVYVYLGALPSAADAELYSVAAMTTRGAAGFDLAQHWRMLGATEAGDGMLLFGISTAFLFYVMLRLWRGGSQRAG
ncbi:MAG: hypothetical protein WB615_01715 [Candidatus Tumulicola sp.]